ncbi:Trk system potassium transporter TrkA [Guyparkeria sp. SCN-R1]|uniref:Trk system potassium transporter TrkA n=1 Tax=unclassified Guyparkeria TaxID=2626246 RepID=UPI000F64A00F|nr:Trk system potassium transporter TrkA [Guyparkeria sp. SCN-R1]RRQ24496.1 Trk system potassium transporter TrkA [Guyparkeria sp. SCN-R1]
MKVIVLGAGQVGSSVATALATETDNSVTVVDTDVEALNWLQERLDIRTVTGLGSQPSVLQEAGAADADILIAVTHSDETNMLACQIAWTLFHTPTKVARIRVTDYQDHPALFDNAAIPVDFIISPERLIKDYIARLIQYPDALQVREFGDGRLLLIGMEVDRGGPMVGEPIHRLRDLLPGIEARVAAIYRHETSVPPEGDTRLLAGDEVFFLARKSDIRRVMSVMRPLDKPYKRIMIAGGGNIGGALAGKLEDDYQVKLISHNLRRARELSASLDRSIVLSGNASDTELLEEENIEDMDVFLALTNDDEDNILAAMLAKRLGARRAMCIVNRTEYVDLIEMGSIDIALSPHQITIGEVLTHLRRGDVVSVYSLRRGAAEAIEIIARGDESTSRVVGRRIDALNLPRGTTIGAILRDDEVLIAHHDTVIRSDDHVVLFLTDKRRIGEIEQLFSVGFGFF